MEGSLEELVFVQTQGVYRSCPILLSRRVFCKVRLHEMVVGDEG